MTYGGILIRGVKSAEENYVSGSIKSLRYLMSHLGRVSQAQQFYLKKCPTEQRKQRIIKKSARIGLNPQKDPLFLSRPYRYLVDWEKEITAHRFKNKTAVRKEGIDLIIE